MIKKVKVFNDCVFMDDNGFSTNIDHILVCQGGVFIIETQSHRNHLRRMFKNTPPKMISMIIFPEAGSLLHVNSKYVYYARNYILEKISEA